MISRWRYLNKNVRIGYGKFAADAGAVIPWLAVFFISEAVYLALFIDALYLFCKIKKIKIRMLPRYIRVLLSGGKKHMAHPGWRKKTLFSIMTLLTCSLGQIDNAKADFVLADASSYTPAVSRSRAVSTGSAAPSGLGSAGYYKGFGHDVRLESVMEMLKPKTWVVRFKSAEMKNILIDFRSEGMTYEDLLTDIAARYGLKISYGKTSGVITVDWKQNECHKHTDEKTKTTVLC